MTIFKHELKLNRISLLIWTSAIVFFIVVCVFMFPEMKKQMQEVSKMFASMGSFTAAFGMDRLNFGELLGFYGVECGNILGLGGAFFAALIGITALAKEEKDHTADFLLTHPVTRMRVVSEKLASIIFQIVALNAVVLLCSVLSILCIGENPEWNKLLLIHLAFFVLQIEIATVCFAISAFIHRGGLGIGLGIATLFYFLNLVANISDSAKALKYITPFGYAESADIVESGSIDIILISIGIAVTIAAIAMAYIAYSRKDIR